MAKNNAIQNNLRIAFDISDENCGNCKFYIPTNETLADGKCVKWEFNSEKQLVCDSFVKGFEDEKEDGYKQIPQSVKLGREYENALRRRIPQNEYAKSHYPNPKLKDYKKQYIIRYFVRQNTIISKSIPIIEVSKAQFNKLQKDFYEKIELKWKIGGSKQDVVDKITCRILEKGIINSNKDTLIFKDSKMNGIRERLGNLVEFSQHKE